MYLIISLFIYTLLHSLRFPILRKILRGIAKSQNPMQILKTILEGEKAKKKKNKKKKNKKNKEKENENKEEEEEEINETENKEE